MIISNAITLIINSLIGLLATSSDSPSTNVSPLPTSNQYWGPGEASNNPDLSIRPFNINFSDEIINDLKYRLSHTRKLQPSLENATSTYGMNSEFLPKIIDYWLNKYNFKEREAHLNQFPQFVTNVQGLDIHYIHVKPKLPENSQIKVLPLLILHGWGGSLVEFYKIIPKLTTPTANQDFVFEVVAPSLPGAGFSDAAAKIGFDATAIATVIKNLMIRVGHQKFYMQAGDWGSAVASNLATLYPENVLGLHSNLCMILSPMGMLKLMYYSLVPTALPEHERPYMPSFTQSLYRIMERSGYWHEQATRPDSLGVGLNDSPAGLAAYIIEKFAELTNYDNRFSVDGNLSNYFTLDELIDNLMFYWVPGKITSSMRIYAESSSIRSFTSRVNSDPIKVPSACASFPQEIIFLPEILIRTRYSNLVQRSIMPRGGHFAALEEPQLLVDDVFKAVEKMQKNNRH